MRTFDVYRVGCALPSTEELVASGMPCWAAVVAAPAQKLWPESEPWQIPMLCKVSRSMFTKRTLASCFPSLKWNRWPAAFPRTDKYAIIAVIGHRLLWVRPRYMFIPFLKGSVLEDFIRTSMIVGFVGLSTAMSGVPLSHTHCRKGCNLSCT